jgi:hypothetical protein
MMSNDASTLVSTRTWSITRVIWKLDVGEFVVPIEGRFFGILTDGTANRGGCFVTLGNGKRAVSVLGDSKYFLQNNLNMKSPFTTAK